MEDKINYTTINHVARQRLGLTWIQYGLADLIHNLANNPKAEARWCYASRETLASTLSVTKQYVIKMIAILIEKGLVERHPLTKQLRTTQLWYDSVVVKKDGKQSLLSVNKVDQDGKQSLPDATHNDGKQSLPNNNNIYNNNYNKELVGLIEEFNKNLNSEYRFTPQLYTKFLVRRKTFSLEDIQTAMRNMLKDPFYRGNNNRSWRATVEYLLRNDEHIERFLNTKRGERPEYDESDPGKTFRSYKDLEQLVKEKKI